MLHTKGSKSCYNTLNLLLDSEKLISTNYEGKLLEIIIFKLSSINCALLHSEQVYFTVKELRLSVAVKNKKLLFRKKIQFLPREEFIFVY